MADLHVTWEQYHQLIERLAVQVYESAWNFDQIICIARGGLRIGDVLSRTFDLPLAILSTHSYTEAAGTLRGTLTIAEHMTMTSPRLGERPRGLLRVTGTADRGLGARGGIASLGERIGVAGNTLEVEPAKTAAAIALH